jgi:hypothetical protein
MTKIVINTCHGGFTLSEAGIKRYAELKKLALYIEGDKYFPTYWTIPKEDRLGFLSDDDYRKARDEDRIKHIQLCQKYTISAYHFDRTDPILVQVVEELGTGASGDCSKLAVIELEKGTLYRIDEYDGYESIETSSDCVWSVA